MSIRTEKPNEFQIDQPRNFNFDYSCSSMILVYLFFRFYKIFSKTVNLGKFQ